MCRAGARFSGPGGVATAAATTFGAMGLGMGAVPPQYPLAFHHLAQTYMHAVWRQGLCHSLTSSSSSSSAASTSATVSLQSWNASSPASPPCGALDSLKSSMASAGVEKGKKTLTPAQRMREYREKLKRNPEVYQRYKQMNALRSRLARMRRSQEQIERDREKARQRNLKNRGPSPRLPNHFDLMALTPDGSALDFSLAGPITPPPTHLLHEPPAQLPHLLQDNLTLPHSPEDSVSMPQALPDSDHQPPAPPDQTSLPPIASDFTKQEDTELPSCSTEDWEPGVTFQDQSGSL